MNLLKATQYVAEKYQRSEFLCLMLRDPLATVARQACFDNIPMHALKAFTLHFLLTIPLGKITREMRNRASYGLLTQYTSIVPSDVNDPVSLLVDDIGWAIVLRIHCKWIGFDGTRIYENVQCIWAHNYRGHCCMVERRVTPLVYFDSDRRFENSIDMLLELIDKKEIKFINTRIPSKCVNVSYCLITLK